MVSYLIIMGMTSQSNGRRRPNYERLISRIFPDAKTVGFSVPEDLTGYPQQAVYVGRTANSSPVNPKALWRMEVRLATRSIFCSVLPWQAEGSGIDCFDGLIKARECNYLQ